MILIDPKEILSFQTGYKALCSLKPEPLPLPPSLCLLPFLHVLRPFPSSPLSYTRRMCLRRRRLRGRGGGPTALVAAPPLVPAPAGRRRRQAWHRRRLRRLGMRRKECGAGTRGRGDRSMWRRCVTEAIACFAPLLRYPCAGCGTRVDAERIRCTRYRTSVNQSRPWLALSRPLSMRRTCAGLC